MRSLLLRFFINAVAIGVIASGIFYPHIYITGNNLATLVVVAVVFGIVNALLRPVITLLTCPIVLLTLGLFIFIINGLMLYLTVFISGLLAQNFGIGGTLVIENALWAIVGAFVVAVIGLVLERVLGVNEQRVVVKKVEVRTIVEKQRDEADRYWDQAVGSGGDFDLIDPETGKPRRP
jgi:putative membrane protein